MTFILFFFFKSFSKSSHLRDDIKAFKKGSKSKQSISKAFSCENQYDTIMHATSKRHVQARELPTANLLQECGGDVPFFRHLKAHATAFSIASGGQRFLVQIATNKYALFDPVAEKFTESHLQIENSVCHKSFVSMNGKLLFFHRTTVHEWIPESNAWKLWKTFPRRTLYSSVVYDSTFDRFYFKSHYKDFKLMYLEDTKLLNDKNIQDFEGETMQSLYTDSASDIMLWNGYIYCFGVKTGCEKATVFRTRVHNEISKQDWEIINSMDECLYKRERIEYLRRQIPKVHWEEVPSKSEFVPPRLFRQMHRQIGRKAFFFGGKYTSDNHIGKKNGLFSFDFATQMWEAYEFPHLAEVPQMERGCMLVWQLSSGFSREMLPTDEWHEDAITKLLLIPQADDGNRPWLLQISPDLRSKMRYRSELCFDDLSIAFGS